MQVSVVCPFYNESAIIENAVRRMIANLEKSGADWELIVVDDGSTDNSLALVSAAIKGDHRVSVISYPYNMGRGHALKTGIEAATKEFIVTTEIDLSWGDGITQDILKKFRDEPHLDVVIASTNLRGGGYKDVPFQRILLSRLGNLIIRLLFTKNITMNTGMTRGYRRQIIQNLRTFEKGKEFHLEVLLKLVTLGARIGEIPATIEWKDHKLSKSRVKRTSSSNIPKLIGSHLNFAVFANPIRYFWLVSVLTFLMSASVFLYGAYRYLNGFVSIYMLLVALLLAISGFIFFGFGIITAQNNNILKELWRKDFSNTGR